MKKYFFLLSLAVLFGASKCQEDAGNTFDLGETIMLKVGEMSKCNCKTIAVQFTGVTEDSRCPKNTNCVWAGEVKTKMDINGQMYEMKLGGDSKEPASVEVDNFNVQLMEVSPYPEGGKKIDPADYVVKVVVMEK
ncbi:MAG: hypothetical protein DHS20C18_52550 [Saprospiraceae bacterium]|nr:MAG: hypothetical protein DHS20C18_52550 [Saprospiraceae bacterium]